VAVEQVCLGKVDRIARRAFGVPEHALHRAEDTKRHTGTAAALVAHRRREVGAIDVAQIEGGGSANHARLRRRDHRLGGVGFRVDLLLGDARLDRHAEPDASLVLGERGDGRLAHLPRRTLALQRSS
jgi:hypothetical protein